MRVRLLALWDELRTSYWFVPTGLVLLALLLAPLTLWLDRTLPLEWLERLPFVAFNQAPGARALLSTVAGSIVTVAGVTFSITMVVLSLATSQFGPRLLRNFVRDAFNQLVLGMFLATFVYCLLVLRTVQAPLEGSGAFVPHLSITIAVLLTLADLILFIGFINQTAESIQVGTVLARIDGQLGRRLRTPASEHRPTAFGLPADFPARAADLVALRGGYLQTIDEAGLLDLASDHELIVRTLRRPGAFVANGTALAQVYPATALHRFESRLRDHFVLGPHRTTTQDLGFLFDQLLEVAVRALSPGVNDPFTATMCSDRIADNLLLLSRRPPAERARHDQQGRLRLLLMPLDGAALASRMFATLRHHAADDPIVLEHLLGHLELLGRAAENRTMRRALADEAERLMTSAEARLDPTALPTIERAYRRARHALAAGRDSSGNGRS